MGPSARRISPRGTPRGAACHAPASSSPRSSRTVVALPLVSIGCASPPPCAGVSTALTGCCWGPAAVGRTSPWCVDCDAVQGERNLLTARNARRRADLLPLASAQRSRCAAMPSRRLLRLVRHLVLPDTSGCLSPRAQAGDACQNSREVLSHVGDAADVGTGVSRCCTTARMRASLLTAWACRLRLSHHAQVIHWSPPRGTRRVTRPRRAVCVRDTGPAPPRAPRSHALSARCPTERVALRHPPTNPRQTHTRTSRSPALSHPPSAARGLGGNQQPGADGEAARGDEAAEEARHRRHLCRLRRDDVRGRAHEGGHSWG
jgi:hypothetical protein